MSELCERREEILRAKELARLEVCLKQQKLKELREHVALLEAELPEECKEETKVSIPWHYVKDEPIPKDGKLRTVAYHSDIEGVEIVQEKFCDEEVSASMYEDFGYYAWTDFLLRPPAYKEDSNARKQIFKDTEHLLTHGGYIKDCEGNACCDGTPVTFPSLTVTIPTAKSPEQVSKGVLRWNLPNLTFMIEVSGEGFGYFTPASAVAWFKKVNVIVNKMCQEEVEEK